MKSILVIILIIFLPNIVWCQLKLQKTIHECGENSLGQLEDTTRLITLDSLKKLMVGNWVLIKKEDYYKDSLPLNFTRMIIDKKGNVELYEHGSQTYRSRIITKIMYGTLRFVMDEPLLSYFQFRSAIKNKSIYDVEVGSELYRNGIRVCEKNLIMYGFTSPGPSLVFERVNHN